MLLEAKDRSHQTLGPFLEGPEKFSHSESHRKILNLMIAELFSSHVINVRFSSYKDFQVYTPLGFFFWCEKFPAGLAYVRVVKEEEPETMRAFVKNKLQISFCFPLQYRGM